MGSVLAIDLGTSGPKVALVALSGEVERAEFEPVPVLYSAGGGAEQRPAEWWEAIVRATRRLLVGPGSGVEEVDAVAITGQWAGTVPVGRDGEPLQDAVTWLDSRGAPHARRLAGGPVRLAGYEPRKLARWLRRTGGAPSLSGRDALGHVLFLMNERRPVYEEADLLLEPVDWLGFKLSGRAATTTVTATLHWLTDVRDLDRVRYDDELVALTGIDPAKLPELLPANAVLGPLSPAAAAELGLPQSAKVIAGTPDTMSAAVGSGAVRDKAAHLYVGTSAWLSCHVPFKRTDPLHSIATLPSALPRRYLVSTEQQTAGVCVERLRDALLPGAGEDGLAQLDALAAAAPPGSDGVIFTPWLNGERTPVDDHLVRGGYFNLSLRTRREHVARATLEGVALNARWMLGHVERFVLGRLDPIAYIGGGARSELWCQVMADVLGREVRRIAAPQHANVRGAALLAGIALGALTPHDVPARAPVEASFAPRAQHRATYDRLFRAYRGIYRANRRLYARLNSGR